MTLMYRPFDEVLPENPTHTAPEAAHQKWHLGSMISGSALLGFGLTRKGLPRLLLTTAGGYLLYRSRIEEARDREQHGLRVERSIDVMARRDEVFGYWRNLENLPNFMSHIKSVRVLDNLHSHWVAGGPAGSEMEWNAEIINEHPNEMIAWRSVEGSEIEHAGTVRFEDRGGGMTRVTLKMEIHPPLGLAGALIARMMGESGGIVVAEDLARFKNTIEGSTSLDPEEALTGLNGPR